MLIPLNGLASSYFVINDNEQTIEQAYSALLIANRCNDQLFPMQLTQIIGLSLFNHQHTELAERYLQHSIALAQEQHKEGYLALSWSFLGLMRSEQKRFAEAELDFIKAIQSANAISDQQARTYIQASVTGYYARAMAMADKLDQAQQLYSQAIELSEKANIQQKLQLAQLHQGLGECLMAKGNLQSAEQELAVAIAFDQEAQNHFEQANKLLTFTTSGKSSKTQMEILKCRLEQRNCSSL
jgi:tetratricopeptide (TPR) repeat protein